MKMSTPRLMQLELRKARRMRQGVRIRVTVRFTQDDLLLLAGGGWFLDTASLREFIRDKAVGWSLHSMRIMHEAWTSSRRSAVGLNAGRAFAKRGRVTPTSIGS
jgi:hypothetical protein